jgi:hypothetical protein
MLGGTEETLGQDSQSPDRDLNPGPLPNINRGANQSNATFAENILGLT